jgi:type I restriction enzyme S subunit
MRVKLKDIGKIVTGKTPSKREESFWDSDDIPFVKPDDFKNDVSLVDKFNTYVSFKGSEKANIVPPNSVLVTCIGTIGKVIINNLEVTTNQQINSIIPNENIDAKYLMYQILTKKAYLNHIANAPVVPIINKTTFGNVEINIHPLNQQKAIANKLDIAQELINLRKASIEKLDELSKALFVDMFGDPVENPKKLEIKKLGDITEVKTGKTPSRKEPLYWKDGTELWATTTEVNKKYITDTDEKITKLAILKNNLTVYPKHTILMAMYGQGKTRGKVAELMVESSINQAFCAILANDSFNTKFLIMYLHISYEELRRLGRGGNQENLNLDIVKNINIIYPNIEEQNKFAKSIEKIETQKALYEQELKAFESLFESLLNESFA